MNPLFTGRVSMSGLISPSKPIFAGNSPEEKKDVFNGKSDDSPVTLIQGLPSEISAVNHCWLWTKSFLDGKLNRSGVMERLELAQYRLPDHMLAQGKLNDFLKTRMQNIQSQLRKTTPKDQYTLDRAYFDLGMECLSLGRQQAWVRTATAQEIKSQCTGVRAVAASYPGPVERQTESFYKALRNTALDFADLAQKFYTAGIQIYTPVTMERWPALSYEREAQVHSNFGHNDAAITTLKRGITEVSEKQAQVTLRHRLAELCESTGQFQEALNQRQWLLQDAESEINRSVQYLAAKHFDVAATHLELGTLDKAITHARKAEALNPGHRHSRGHHGKYGETYTDFVGRILIAQTAKEDSTTKK